MYKMKDYMYFSDINYEIAVLEMYNRVLDENKLSRLSSLKNEKIKEFIATNNIEGDVINFTTAKKFLREELNATELEKRWMGIKGAHDVIWDDNYVFNSEYLDGAHRALLRHVGMPGGVYKSKINQVGSLITAHPDDVPKLMQNAYTNYLTSKMSEGPSLYNVIPLISEFLAIHPYEDGNGRMSRLLMARELYDAGFKFVKYVSVSKFLWEQRDEYITALESRNNAWAKNSMTPADLIPLFNVIVKALKEAALVAMKEQNRRKFTRAEFRAWAQTQFMFPLSLSEVIEKMNISNSKASVSNWLRELVDEDIIQVSGKGKGSKYQKINSKYLY